MRWVAPARERQEAGLLAVAGVLCVAGTLWKPPYLAMGHSSTVGRPVTLNASEADAVLSATTRHLQDSPEDFQAWVQKAIACYSKGPAQYPTGLNALEEARRLGATGPDLFYYAGVMYEGLGLVDYALAELERYNRHDPGRYEVLVRLGNLYARQVNWTRAQQAYEEALQRRGRDATVWFNLGIARKGQQQYDAALEAFRKAESLAGSLPEGGVFQIGDVWRLKGDLPMASAAFEKELVRFPEFIPALQALESLARQNKDWKAARQWRQRISDVQKKQAGQ